MTPSRIASALSVQRAPVSRCRWTLRALATPALLLALTLPGADLAAQGASASEVKAVDAVFEDWQDAAGPGAAVAVTRDGRTIYSQGYGSAQLEYRIPVTPTTPFHVASVSKQFTTFAVALLAHEGHLSWDDPVHDHLPDLPDLGDTVTLRQLANHTSGVRDQWELLIMAGWRIDDVITRDQIMDLMARQRELNFEPGSEYLYSNMGYSLLAEVVEEVSGEGFADFLHERVFLPLGMHRTHVHDDHTHIVPGRAYSYRPDDSDAGWSEAVLNYANQGATSLFTTVEDLARWLAEMEEPAVGTEDLWAEMAEPARLNNGESASYGLGLSVDSHRGLATQGHGGSDAGFRTNLLHFPEERLGVVVFGNAASFNAGSKARQVAEVFLEDEMDPREENGLEPEPTVTVDADILEELEGMYRVAEDVMVTVEREGEALSARMPDDETHELEAESDATFWAPEPEGRFTFQRDEERRVEGLTFVHPEGGMQARRVEVEALSTDELREYEGPYYSPELDVVYRFEVEDGELKANPPRQPAVELFPLDRDRFGSSSWGLNTVEFIRDDDGEIDGFRASGGRVRNLRFHRVEDWDL